MEKRFSKVKNEAWNCLTMSKLAFFIIFCASLFFLFFWVSVQLHLWSIFPYSKSRFGSSTPALSAFISCVWPLQSACIPLYLYQSEIPPLQSLHPSHLRSSDLLVKYHWRPRKMKILLFLTSAPLWPLPIPLEQFIEVSICYANL